jgi:hypothetical protein
MLCKKSRTGEKMAVVLLFTNFGYGQRGKARERGVMVVERRQEPELHVSLVIDEKRLGNPAIYFQKNLHELMEVFDILENDGVVDMTLRFRGLPISYPLDFPHC